jgi:release factor glutamine methyltransferase
VVIYQPAEDSFLLNKFLEKYLKKNKVETYLDMGAGSGILSATALKYLEKKNILAVDINPEAVQLLKKLEYNVIQSDFFGKISGKFDLITFNAPYLPLDPREPEDSQVATTGGKRGDEASLKFLRQAKEHLNVGGKIFLLVSSLTPMDKLKKYKPKKVARKKVFMEELIILEFC